MSVRSSPSRVSATAQPYRDSTEHTQCSPALLVIFVSAIFWSVTAPLNQDDQQWRDVLGIAALPAAVTCSRAGAEPPYASDLA